MTPPSAAVVEISTPTSTRKLKETKIPDAIRCLIDVADIDGKLFSTVRPNGKTSNKGAPLRKLVLMVIARYASHPAAGNAANDPVTLPAYMALAKDLMAGG